MKKVVLSVLFVVVAGASVYSQFISDVLEYKPAPGQHINANPWGVPSSANTIIGDVNGTLNLGSFGGYVVFKFENPVENNPDNPYGVDFTIFGNPTPIWSEPAIVSVMKDENNNGIADDIWYELAGSDYFFSSTIKNYQVIYINPNQDVAANVPWTDNFSNSGEIFANSYYDQAYYPIADSFPDVDEDSYTLIGTYITGDVDRSNSMSVKSYTRAFGYADNQIRGSVPYTLPDNPYTSEMENSGGDAFDINWAIDSEGNYIELDEIDFVKVHNAMLGDAGWLGEISPEITGAVDVEPNVSVSGEVDLIVLKELPDTIYAQDYQLELFTFTNGRINDDLEVSWTMSSENISLVDDNIVHFNESGEVLITAYLTNKLEVSQTITAYVDLSNGIDTYSSLSKLAVYPSPASDFVFVECEGVTEIEIYNSTGDLVRTYERVSQIEKISIDDFSAGLYIIKAHNQNKVSSARFIKE